MKFYRIRRSDGKYCKEDYWDGWDVIGVAKIFKSKAAVTIRLKRIRNGDANFDPSRYIIERCKLEVEESIPLEDW